MKNTILKLILIIGLIPVASPADDTVMGSVGGNVFPSQSNSIQMTKEEVYIRLFRDSCKVFCKFWFHNFGEKQRVVVGFPDKLETPGYQTAPIRAFTTKVNGIPVKVEKAEQIIQQFDDGSKVKKYWYTWEMDFPGNATTIIENSYVGSWGGTYSSCFFSYEIGTGRTWFKNIAAGKIIFDHSQLASSCFIIKKKVSAGVTMSQRGDSLIYSFQNYEPRENEKLRIEILNYWSFIESPIFFRDRLNELRVSKEIARLMRNEIFARHGYCFKNAELRKYFESKHWYVPNPAFRFDDLSEKEKLAVAVFKEYEKSLK